MQRATQFAIVVAAALVPTLALANDNTRTIGSSPTGLLTPRRHAGIHTRIHARILQREVVRAPSPTTVSALVAAPGNASATQRGTALANQLQGLARSGQATSGVRNGYGAKDVEYKARGLAKSLACPRGRAFAGTPARGNMRSRWSNRAAWCTPPGPTTPT